MAPAMLLVLLLPLPVDAAEAHSPILIMSDRDFTERNGVRSGSGEVHDPYVIADWAINGAGTLVLLQNTSKHVLLRDMTLVGTDDDRPGFIHVVQSNHVTMESTSLRYVRTVVEKSAFVRFINSSFVQGANSGLLLEDSRDVLVDGNHFVASGSLSTAVRAVAVEGVLLQQNAFLGSVPSTSVGISIMSGRDVSIQANDFFNMSSAVRVWGESPYGPAENIVVRSNRLLHGVGDGIAITGTAVHVKENRVIGGLTGIDIGGSTGEARHNDISDVEIGIVVSGDGYAVRNNTVRNATVWAIQVYGEGNRFVSNQCLGNGSHEIHTTYYSRPAPKNDYEDNVCTMGQGYVFVPAPFFLVGLLVVLAWRRIRA